MTNQELDELRDIFYELGKLVQRYGGKYYTIQLNIIMGIIECIDSEATKEEKTVYVLERYKALSTPRDGLSDFYIHDDDFHTRLELNKPLDGLKERLWEIMKQYV